MSPIAARQVLIASLNALAEVAAPLERWQADTAALLDDLAVRLAAPRSPPSAAVAAQVGGGCWPCGCGGFPPTKPPQNRYM